MKYDFMKTFGRGLQSDCDQIPADTHVVCILQSVESMRLPAERYGGQRLWTEAKVHRVPGLSLSVHVLLAPHDAVGLLRHCLSDGDGGALIVCRSRFSVASVASQRTDV